MSRRIPLARLVLPGFLMRHRAPIWGFDDSLVDSCEQCRRLHLRSFSRREHPFLLKLPCDLFAFLRLRLSIRPAPGLSGSFPPSGTLSSSSPSHSTENGFFLPVMECLSSIGLGFGRSGPTPSDALLAHNSSISSFMVSHSPCWWEKKFVLSFCI